MTRAPNPLSVGHIRRSDTRLAGSGEAQPEPAKARPALTGAIGALPSRTVVVLDAIKHAILTGELQPGQGLVETDLAGVLGVSKTPVREALKTLAGAGLVTMSPYKGAAVRGVDDDLVRSVYDLRLLLEPEAVRRAVAHGGQAGAARHALRRSDQAADRAERSLANRDFHRALYLGCGNAMLVSVLDDLRDRRPPWCPRRPGSARRPGEPKPPSTRRFSAPPPPATRMQRPGC